jgi:hypothetical protein
VIVHVLILGITQLGRVFVQNTEVKKNLEFFNPDLDQHSQLVQTQFCCL